MAGQQRAIRKEIKRNRKPDRVRHRDWLRADLSQLDALSELAGEERVMPRGERERRRATRVTPAVAEASDAGPGAAPEPQAALTRAIVVQVASSLCRVELGDSPAAPTCVQMGGSRATPADGRSLLCSLRGGLSAQDTGFTNVVAVGDTVLVSGDGERGMVEQVLPRRSALARPDVFRPHLRQVLVANVDQVLVVASWLEPALWFELLDRYLIAAARSGLAPVICVNKVDLAANSDECRAALAPYVALGQRVVLASAVTGEGVAELRELLQGRTTALAGLSGVGKSTLLAAVQPGLVLRTGAVSERRHEGRHTTTQVTLHRLDGGGFVADTPGIREFGLAGLRRAELVHYYPEIAAAASECRFADCAHNSELGCAVRAAVRSGRIAAVRYDSYRRIAGALP